MLYLYANQSYQMPSIAVSLTSYLLCISISVAIQLLLRKMNVWTCETSSLSFISFQKSVKNSLFITAVNFLFFLRLLVWYNYSADHSDLRALIGPKHYLKPFDQPMAGAANLLWERFFFFGFSRFYIGRVLGVLCSCQTSSRRDWSCL